MGQRKTSNGRYTFIFIRSWNCCEALEIIQLFTRVASCANRRNLFHILHEIDLKAIGGSGVKKTCHTYFKELIAVVLTLFTECQNSTRFRRYDQFNFRGLDFYIGNKGIIFGDFGPPLKTDRVL